MLTKPLKDTGDIFLCRVRNGFQILLVDIRRTEAEHPIDDRLIHRRMMNPHDILTHRQKALMSAVFLGEHIAGHRLFIVDEHDIHCAVTDIAKHIHSGKFGKPVCHCRKALRENIHADNLNMVGNSSKAVINSLVLHEIFPKAASLTADPCEGETCRDSYLAACYLADIHLTGNGRKSENIVVNVLRFIREEFFMALTDEVIPAVKDEQIFLEYRLSVITCDTSGKAAIRGLDIAVAAVNSDDKFIVDNLHFFTSVSVLYPVWAYTAPP